MDTKELTQLIFQLHLDWSDERESDTFKKLSRCREILETQPKQTVSDEDKIELLKKFPSKNNESYINKLIEESMKGWNTSSILIKRKEWLLDYVYCCNESDLNPSELEEFNKKISENKLFLEWMRDELEPQTNEGVKYNELLMAVKNKFPNETRHETAYRYICEAENLPHSKAQQNKKSDDK